MKRIFLIWVQCRVLQLHDWKELQRNTSQVYDTDVKKIRRG